MFYLGACGTNELGFELALEEVHYKGVISHLVPLPCLLCHHLHQQTRHIIRPCLDENVGRMVVVNSVKISPQKKFLILRK